MGCTSAFAAADSRPFGERVVDWQRCHGRQDLPWQDCRDPYRIWLSEIMLQQTQVATVLPYFSRFVAEFPTVAALAAAPLSRVLELWSGLGYYRRAHHLHATARSVVDDHAGRFPADAATLVTLPGIGRSTAAAIAAFASGERGAILDGNARRVLARHRGIDGWPGVPSVEARLWRAAEGLLPSNGIAAYTQGLMDLGATVCVRARPRCDACPVAGDCVARIEGRIPELPSPRPRRTLPKREVTILLLERDAQILLEQRPAYGIWGGLWSFPEVPPGSDIPACVAARFGATAQTSRRLAPITHLFTHFALTMHPVRVPILRWPLDARMPGAEWFGRAAAIGSAIPSPIRKLLRTLDPYIIG